jgi:hypothetical protein
VTALEHPEPPAAPAPSSRRRWLVAVVVAWALVLVGAAYLSSRRDPPTVREQRPIEQAAPVVWGAAGRLAAAAGGPGAVVEMTPSRLTRGCRLTTAREGATLELGLRIYTATADAPALLDRIAQTLPGSYRAQVRHGKDETAPTFRADAGEFVGVRGGVSEPGLVTLTVATGCRPLSAGWAGAVALLGTPADAMAERVLAALGAEQADWGRIDVPCPGRGAVRTARLTSRPGTAPGPLRAALHEIAAGATIVADTPERLAYRQGEFGVVVEARDDVVTVAATTDCPGQ